ncbi:UbiD family decarboxylase [Saccharibacillus qingshengii]|uniref:UbiD family decarboxylase n=1 Tax=Saccharibacillus qingshengii TaxID=1763540 RepID=UPI0015529C04|nr:UbiD family decarboxylase [Saccharibacillus qingshengii]
MRYRNMQECIADLEQAGHLIRVTEEVDPNLEMAAIHLRTFEAGGPALFFEKVKGSKYGAVSNLFGTIERSKYIFRDTWELTQEVIALRNDPMKALKQPHRYAGTGLAARKALPIKKSGLPADFEEIRISDLPMIKSWPNDGGAFVTLPQVYSEDPDKPGVMNANLGMYRIQLSGNEYEQDREIGVHYQIHRGIGVHQSKAAKRGQPLKVSCFIGGPPAHTLSAVMPLPEGLSELTFAGLLSGRHFRYSYEDGFCVSHDADFVITGEIYPDETKPEGPFGDHLGYYSLVHEFPVMRVHKVYAKKKAVYPFTVVGRPPQEDTAFGALIHELTGGAVQQEIPGVKEVHAVDAAGVHPLLLAVGSERYTPYQAVKRPAEILTIANRIFGTGQLSLAKYLFITAEDDVPVNAHDIPKLFAHVLERIDLRRDLHFQTNTTMDTLDYSGTGLNSGSKVTFAAVGSPVRKLSAGVPAVLADLPGGFGQAGMAMPGIALLQGPAFVDYESAEAEIGELAQAIAARGPLGDCPMIVLCDDSAFMEAAFDNFLWAGFTRSNPSHDIYGVNAAYEHKHWGCDNVIIDARVKPHQAPPLIPDAGVAERVDRLFEPSGSLGILRALRR